MYVSVTINNPGWFSFYVLFLNLPGFARSKHNFPADFIENLTEETASWYLARYYESTLYRGSLHCTLHCDCIQCIVTLSHKFNTLDGGGGGGIKN